VGLAHIFTSVRLPLLINSGAQILLLGGNLLLLVNFVRTACVWRPSTAATLLESPLGKVEAHVS
jgi:hypothetical protein